MNGQVTSSEQGSVTGGEAGALMGIGLSQRGPPKFMPLILKLQGLLMLHISHLLAWGWGEEGVGCGDLTDFCIRLGGKD